ncbi:MAG: 2-hydroxymuconate tautomerase [Panacagrimonas sp.]
MPIIQFNLMEGRTIEQKRRLAEKVTDTVVEVLGVKRESVRILIHEMGLYDFSVGGVTAADRAAINGVQSNGAAASAAQAITEMVKQ